MNPVTTYTSSDGTVKNIADLNNFHLVNALLKVSDVLALNPNGFGDAKEEYEGIKATQKALKDEVFKRMDNRPKEKQSLRIPFTENDCEELMSGEEFHWNYATDKGEEIAIHILKEEQE